ncbi:TPA: DMT family transporter [Mannheimia haemolytica]|uniref:DMT family transporter n=1 Tax=Mannheimia haemolytica TaxID=75985 RepID=UPI000DA3F1DF|nr:DMT family transporter [Mannheimia haemolytica]MCB4227357.1 DMT family transporter [Mannheimia haemolytica]MEE3731828.1 DMT family transporter [Mannheimia haemolytica]UQX78682.1 DMT family transporter [Mannheimia haemolytica]SQE31498.1 EamA-like transporter family [Mannheimia haemolytica]HDL1261686.1 DMT family transporter [Mannheimia haemolytica]
MPSSYQLVLINLLYIFGIGLNIVLLRFLSLHFDPLNNNGIRFLVGGFTLLFFILWRFRTSLSQLIKTPKLIAISLFVGLMMSANMYFWLKGVKITNAVTASIFGVLAMPFGVIIAAIFFQDERERIKSKAFWFGSILTIIGSLGFIWHGKTLSIGEGFILGSVFLFLSIIIRNIQNLVVKFARELNVLTLSCVTSLTTSLSSLLLSQQAGKFNELFTAPNWLLFSLMVAGIYAIMIGMVLTFHIIQTQGLITYQVLELLMPVSTAIIAYILLDERISIVQMGFACIVILGSSIALKLVKYPKHY